MNYGKSIRLFLIEGIADGRWMCELSNWTGKAYKIPRNCVKESSDREELKNTGIYFLFGKSDESDNCLVKLSKCCNPVPGDNIVGYITRGRGVSVHRADCKNLKDLFLDEESRMIDVYWYTEKEAAYNVDIEIFANDRSGLLADIISQISTTKTKLVAVNCRANKERIAITDITIEVEDLEQLNNVLKAIRKVDSVYEVKRKK